jgi:uncharacterized repeat protein (TIGR03803 family)
MRKFDWGIKACGVLLLWAATAVALLAQTTTVAPNVTFTTLFSFDNTDGAYPYASLVQGTDGSLYGTTLDGGANSCCGYDQEYSCGTVFKITTSGKLTALHSFDGTDGWYPLAGLVQGTNGDFYGTTYYGGARAMCTLDDGCGTVFKITPSGKLTTLYNGFCYPCPGGFYPEAGLIEGTDGKFYGTTTYGGANNDSSPAGMVFSITPRGKLTTVYSFCEHSSDYLCTDGAEPNMLVQAADGNFYGTALVGGESTCFDWGCGTIFRITPSGSFTRLYSFGRKGHGNYPNGLIQATDGNFYGTTFFGGINSCPEGGCGTVFKITPRGKLTTLYKFTGGKDGFAPVGLVQGTDGNFYGTTIDDGPIEGDGRYGTVFSITAKGKLTTLYEFTGGNDGGYPDGGLIQDTDGKFYGATVQGGGANDTCNPPYGCGTVFSLSVSLEPFVETNPTSGKVGAAVKILGTSLTGATSVTFNGTATTFTVKSKTEITTIVPAGATTGTVQVVTPGGTLSSNVPFRVTH